DANATDGDGCDSNCTTTRCGNGVVTAGEACDDGNLAAGDCCSATCTFEASGTACDDGDVCTTTDACDGAGACAGAEAPRTGCHAAGGASFQLKDPSTPAKRKLAWKWLRGDTAQAELGDHVTGGTSFTLCAYDTTAATSHVALRAGMPAGGTCRG